MAKEKATAPVTTGMFYDPAKGKWVAGNAVVTPSSKNAAEDAKAKAKTASSSKKASSTPQYHDVQINVLEGDLDVVPNEETLLINVGDTVRMIGLGQYISGGYLISGKTLTLNSDEGLSLSFKVVRPNFVDTLKG